MSLPENVAVGRSEQDIGVVGRGEIDQLFPFLLVIEERHEMRMLRSRDVFAHAANDGAVDEGWGALQFSQLINGEVRIVWRKIASEALAPGGRLLAAFVGEADGEEEVLGAPGLGEDDFGIVKGFTLDRWDGLGTEGRHREKDKRKN